MAASTEVPSSDQLFGWIGEIVRQGVRRPGYPADQWVEQWAARMFEDLGLEDVRLEPVTLPRWEPLGWRLEVWPQGDPEATVEVPGFPLPHSAPADNLEADLCLFSSEEHDEGQAESKLAVSELALLRLPQEQAKALASACYDPDGDFESLVQVLPFGPRFMEVMEPAIAAGASGFIGALTGVPWETCQYYVPYDAVLRSIPGLWVSAHHGSELCRRVAEGPMRGRLSIASERRPTVTNNVIGMLPGRSSEWVIIGSHHDAPWASAVEDASGTALVMAQADYWSRIPASSRPHNLLFLLTSGHMAAGAGTRTFIEEHRELLPHVVLGVPREHAARQSHTRDGELVPTDDPEVRWWFTSRNDELRALVSEAIRKEDLRRSLVLPPDVFPPQPPTDGGFFYGEGVPLVQFLTAPMYLFDAADTLDKIHVPTLEPLTRAVVDIVAGTGSTTAARLRHSEE
jgi:hypothetical protein